MPAILMATSEVNRVRDLVGKAIEKDVSHIDIYFEESLGGAIGIACSPRLILIQRDYWEATSDYQKFALMMHEIGHTFGVLHSTRFTNFTLYGGIYTIPESIMFPSMFYLPQHRLEIFMNHYVMEMREELKSGNRMNFAFIWMHTFTRERCKLIIGNGQLKELYDER